MPRINKATDTGLKVIEMFQKIGRKRGNTLRYQQEYKLLLEQQRQFEDRKRAIEHDYHEVNQLLDNRFAYVFNEL
jgi:hypothetical protein